MKQDDIGRRIALIGLGEVGRCYAPALHAASHPLNACEIRMTPAATALASDLGMAVHDKPGHWLADVDWVLSCVPGVDALPVVQSLVPMMRAGARIVDMTTASPQDKRDADAAARAGGIRYTDVAIMGGIAHGGVRTPLLAAGPDAEDFKALIEQAGGRAQVLAGGGVGDAISLKFLRTIFTKGLEALSVEMLMSAERQGVREMLYAQLSDIDQAPLRSFIDSMVRTHVIHARRRAHEVHDAQGELGSQGIRSAVLPGVEARFHQTAAALERHPLPTSDPSIDQAIDWLLTTSR